MSDSELDDQLRQTAAGCNPDKWLTGPGPSSVVAAARIADSGLSKEAPYGYC